MRRRAGEDQEDTRRRLTWRIEQLAEVGWIPVGWDDVRGKLAPKSPAESHRVRCPHCEVTFDHSSGTAREKHLIKKHGYSRLDGFYRAHGMDCFEEP